VELAVCRHFAAGAVLERVPLERMLAGVSTRRYRGTNESMGAEVEAAERSVSRAAIWASFIKRHPRGSGCMSFTAIAHAVVTGHAAPWID
jgi:hypothetical protein